MKVTLMSYAKSPNDHGNKDTWYTNANEYLAKQAAAICVDKLDNPSNKGFEKAVESGHHSILEHLPITWVIEDISRACSHQLVRHRIASYSQQSQRYAKVNTDEQWYVFPESVSNSYAKKHLSTDYDTGEKVYSYMINNRYNNLMKDIATLYNDMCEAGIPNEDARMILPNACFTSIMVSMNARSFIEAATLRLCNKAQWEIKELFKLMRESIKDVYPTVYTLAVPNCYKHQGCLEAIPCKTPRSLYEK